MGSKSKGQEDENAFKSAATLATNNANAATATAANADPLEERRRANVLALDKWENGESGPIDIRNMPGNGVDMALFNDSMQVHDAGRIGKGYGSLASNANPNFVASLDKQNEMERHLAAQGALEAGINNKLAAKNAEMSGLYTLADNRNMNIASLEHNAAEGAEQRNFNFKMMRRQQPNFFKTLANSFAQGAGQGAGMAAGA